MTEMVPEPSPPPDHPEPQTDTGRECRRRAQRVVRALDALDGNVEELRAALASYFEFLALESTRGQLRQVGPAAEVHDELRRAFPIEALPDLRWNQSQGLVKTGLTSSQVLRLIITDLSAFWVGAFLTPDSDEPRPHFRRWRERLLKIEGMTEYRWFAEVDCPCLLEESLLSSALRADALRLVAEALLRMKWSPEEKLKVVAPEQKATPETVLNLQVWHCAEEQAAKTRITKLDIPDQEASAREAEQIRREERDKSLTSLRGAMALLNDSLEDTLLHWGARDKFLMDLVLKWKWLVTYDYTARDSGELRAWYRSNSPNFAVRGLVDKNGQPDNEWQIKVLKGAPYELGRVRYLAFGERRMGKSNFLVSYFYNNLQERQRSSDPISFVAGQAMINFYNTEYARWRAGEPSHTNMSTEYKFDYGEMPGSTYDYRGELAMLKDPATALPVDREELINLVRCAGGFLFFLDDRHFTGEEIEPNAAAGAAWTHYVAILREYEMMHHGGEGIPIALVINKIDKILGEDIVAQLDSPALMHPRLDPRLLKSGIGADGEPEGLFERFKHVLLHNPDANRNPRLQRFVRRVAAVFGDVFKEVLRITPRFQIFLAASVHPERVAAPLRPYYPFGVSEAIDWIISHFERPFLQQAQALLRADISELEKRIGYIRQQVSEASDHSRLHAEAEAKLDKARIAKWFGGNVSKLETLVADKKKAFLAVVKNAVRFAAIEFEPDQSLLPKDILTELRTRLDDGIKGLGLDGSITGPVTGNPSIDGMRRKVDRLVQREAELED